MAIMTSHHSDDKENGVSHFETNSKTSYDELYNASLELNAECLIFIDHAQNTRK